MTVLIEVVDDGPSIDVFDDPAAVIVEVTTDVDAPSRAVDEVVFSSLPPGVVEVKVGEAPWRNVGGVALVDWVALTIGSPPTGDDLIVDVKRNGVSIFSAVPLPTIVAGETEGQSDQPDDYVLVDGDLLTVDVVQVGSSAAGADLTVQIRIRR